MNQNQNQIAINAIKILELTGATYEVKIPDGRVMRSGYKKEKLVWDPELFALITETFEVGDELGFNVTEYNPREIQSFWSVAVTKAKKAWGDKNYQTEFDKELKIITLRRIHPV